MSRRSGTSPGSAIRRRSARGLESALWTRHDAELRDPHQIASQWEGASRVDPRLFAHRAQGDFWEALARARVTLLVTREYEHMVMALSVRRGSPAVSYLRVPHPSGIVFDARRGVIHLASTRNPNLILDLMPVTGVLDRLDTRMAPPPGRPLVPVRSRAFPGSFYLHDMAMIGGRLHGNAVGHNAVVRLEPDGRARRVWWPRSIERASGPEFGRNRIQLNSIGAGRTMRSSYYSASGERPIGRLPGQVDYPVDRRGVIFSGATREPIVRGLTRPHSVRLHGGQVWVDNSGYGELGFAEKETFRPVVRLPGWTRGLGFAGGIAFVGTSRVIPRFRAYAPGLDVERSTCGVHAVDARSGRVIGSLTWPRGNQIFGIEVVPDRFTLGFPFTAPASESSRIVRVSAAAAKEDEARIRNLFYLFTTRTSMERER